MAPGHETVSILQSMVIILLATACLLYDRAVHGAEAPRPAQSVRDAGNPRYPTQSRYSSTIKSADETHSYIEHQILEEIVHLDEFFGSNRNENMSRANYLLRWKNALRLGNGGKLTPSTTIRANIHLSSVNERLRLYIAGEDVTDTTVQTIPEEPGNPGLDRTTQSARLVNTELRYRLKQSPEVDSFLGAGIRLKIPPETFIRGRYQYNRQLGADTVLRLGETLFLINRIGFGETTDLGLELLLNPGRLLRWSNSGTVSQSITGMEWGSELSLIQELSSNSAAALIWGAYGNTSSSALIGNYRIRVNYRRNFLRPWLFCEIEPETDWPRESSGRYSANMALTIRIEVVFDGSVSRHK